MLGTAAATVALAVLTAGVRVAGPPQDAATPPGGAQPDAESEEVARYREQADGSDRPIDHYNFGTALLNDGQVSEAQIPLQVSIGSERTDVRESAFYNLGLSSALDGRFAQSDPSARRAALQSAREAFRSVLRVRADDEDARWNLELVERWLEEEGESGGDEQQSGRGTVAAGQRRGRGGRRRQRRDADAVARGGGGAPRARRRRRGRDPRPGDGPQPLPGSRRRAQLVNSPSAEAARLTQYSHGAG